MWRLVFTRAFSHFPFGSRVLIKRDRIREYQHRNNAANPLGEGLAAYQRGDYATVMRLLRPLADQGMALAQFSLGVMYANGKGVPQDSTQAANWFRKAADQGNADAQANLGAMYAKGKGVSQDSIQAVDWFRKAADQGNADAPASLGWMYATGRGVPQDFVQAVQWSLKAPRKVMPMLR
jgi:TPR repeat protein